MTQHHLSLLLLPLLAGCSHVGRPLTDAAAGAGGAYLGHRLSDGDPWATVGGAAGGVLLSEGLQAIHSAQERKAFTTGYQLGRSDGVKELYWNLQEQQRARETEASHRLLEIPQPARVEGEVLLEPSTRTLRIQEE